MTDDFIGIDITGLVELQERMAFLYPLVADMGVESANEFMLAYEQIAYARPAFYNEPFVWTSERQRRAYFATDGFGAGIPYQRSGELGRGWTLLGYGKNQILVNEVPYSRWVKEPVDQQIGLFLRGWTDTAQDVKDNTYLIVRHFEDGTREAIIQLFPQGGE